MKNKNRKSFRPIAARSHEYYCMIWELVKRSELENLDAKRRILGQLMVEHPEYHYFWEVPYAITEAELQETFDRGGVDADRHLEIEAMIVEQIEARDPPEIYQAFEALLRIGTEAHEVRHVIGRVFIAMVWDGLRMAKKGQRPDENFYLRKIRRLIKRPKEVIKEQEEVSDMRLPSNEEWESAILESEKAFREALAMPNRTIPEALIQGAELVNAIGAKVIFLMAGLTEPKKGVMYEDELEARAAIETFKEACNEILNKLDEVLRFLDEQRT